MTKRRVRQMATVSECRYRWLRVPATTFVITHSPSRSKRRDGFDFSEGAEARRRSRSGCKRGRISDIEEKIALSTCCEKFGADVRIVSGAPIHARAR